MITTIENDVLRVQVSTVGAELQSVCRKADGHEYLWQGDPSVWPNRSPLLFPYVGRLKGRGYEHGGKWYAMDIHGFAADAAFEVVGADAASVRMELAEAAGARAAYPFAYRLQASYALEGNALQVLYRVCNPGTETLYFSIGAHPGFNCAMGDALCFEREEALAPYRLTPEGLLSESAEEACGMGALTLVPGLFDRDALIFKNLASRSVRLRRQNGLDVTVAYGDAPCLGIWAKPDAPYVCIEPWYGVDDDAGVSIRLKEKPHIQALEPGGTFEFPITIQVDNARRV